MAEKEIKVVGMHCPSCVKAVELCLTDVDGILLDVNNSNTIINSISIEKGRELLENGFIGGGMLPKLKNCINSVENGVNEVAIINGSQKDSLISYFITKGKIGTTISNL